MQRHVRRFLALMMAALLALSTLTVAVAEDWRDLLRDLYGLTDDYEVEEQTEVYLAPRTIFHIAPKERAPTQRFFQPAASCSASRSASPGSGGRRRYRNMLSLAA